MIVVSVIIPVYNAAQYLERCISSFLVQSMSDYELILVDDGSTDGSSEICDRYDIEHDNIHVIHQANQGVSAARQKGLDIAEGRYCIFADPDDWVELNMYELMYNAAHPKGEEPIDIVLCNYMLHEKNGEKKGFIKVFESPQDYIKNIYEKSASLFFLWMRLVSSDLIKAHSIYAFPDINFGEDRNVSIRINHYAKTVLILPQHFYHYNKLNQNAITRSSRDKKLWKSWKHNVDLISDFLLSENKKEYRKASNYLKFDA